jgi:hypothetical protein
MLPFNLFQIEQAVFKVKAIKIELILPKIQKGQFSTINISLLEIEKSLICH